MRAHSGLFETGMGRIMLSKQITHKKAGEEKRNKLNNIIL